LIQQDGGDSLFAEETLREDTTTTYLRAFQLRAESFENPVEKRSRNPSEPAL